MMTTNETDADYKNRFMAALKEMESHKLKKQVCRPPLYRLFWLLGLKVRPPLYISGTRLFLSYAAAIALLWACFLYFLHWKHDALSLSNLSLGKIVFYSFLVGTLIGGISAWQYAYTRRRYQLTPWVKLA